MNQDEWNLNSSLENILKFRSDREWEKFHKPKNVATALSIEAGELQELFLWKEIEDSAHILKDKKRYNRIIEEIADIQIYLLYLSNDLGINLAEAVNKKCKQNAKKYPIEKYRGKL